MLSAFSNRQWGKSTISGTNGYVNLPIMATPYMVIATDAMSGSDTKLSTDYVISYQYDKGENGKVYFVSRLDIGAFCWITMCN